MTEREVAAVRDELRRHEGDLDMQITVALEHGFCPAFVPVIHEGSPALAFGIWQGIPIDRSEDGRHRAIAAVIYCNWTRQAV